MNEDGIYYCVQYDISGKAFVKMIRSCHYRTYIKRRTHGNVFLTREDAEQVVNEINEIFNKHKL